MLEAAKYSVQLTTALELVLTTLSWCSASTVTVTFLSLPGREELNCRQVEICATLLENCPAWSFSFISSFHWWLLPLVWWSVAFMSTTHQHHSLPSAKQYHLDALVIAKVLLLSLDLHAVFFRVIFFFSRAIYFTVKEENLELYFTGWLKIPWRAGWSCLSSLRLGENTCFLSQFSYETIPAF